MVNDYKNLYEIYLRKAVGLLLYYNFEAKEKKTEYKDELANFIIKEVNEKSTDIFKNNEKYLSVLKDNLIATGKIVKEIQFVSVSRVLVDTSSPFGWLIDETGLAWDPLLNTPYIPSTEVKGAISAVVEFEKDNKKLRDLLFGSTKESTHKSLVDFSHAYPIACGTNLIEREVITPIYGGEPPRIKEYEATPTPIQFLVITLNVAFKMFLIIDRPRLSSLLGTYKKIILKSSRLNNRERIVQRLIEDLIRELKINKNPQDVLEEEIIKELEEKLKLYIKEAIERWGIGAKTSSGYGRFKMYGGNYRV